jgi:hypothetical protein
MIRTSAFATLAGLALLLAGTRDACAQRPSAKWRTIETEHFRVHFPEPFSAWAQRAAATLEGVHDRVADFVGYLPPRKIDVVVGDPEADSNGAAFPFLDRPRIEIWATPPDPESGLGEFRDWTELLVTHELAHIVHLTRPRNRPGVLERLVPLPIGPVLLNSPRWLAEGYATLVEGALTGSGRPSSAYRAMVLRRFAIEGKLPSYSGLDATAGWLGGSMAYLVGSSYLEWLEAREGPGSLRRLWKRMASRRGGSFSVAFRAVFGRPPSDLYDRFRAEITARALEQERRLETDGLIAGTTWQRLQGATASPEVSPDGTRLLARRAPRRGESYIAVWTIDPSDKESRAAQRRDDFERKLAADPNEIVDKPQLPTPREPAWRLLRRNGRSPEDPRWMPDGRQVLFTLREPSSDGVLHRDLFLWTPESGSVVRVTRGADVGDADPAPDARSAIAVRVRFGVSELVRVDLATGDVKALERTRPEDPWIVWSHPRLSPDGSSIAALLHRDGLWRLALVSSDGTTASVRETGDGVSAFGAPAWSRDGRRIDVATDASGVWEIAEFDREAGPPRTLTRVTGGAYSPAPDPRGGIFFLELTAKGVDLSRLSSDAAAVTAGAGRLPSILPPPAADASPLVLSPTPPERPYGAWATQVVRAFSAFRVGPDGSSWQSGVEGSDVVGRLDWIAAAAVGNAAGPRGGTVALRWSGLPVSLAAQLFSALERPGSQRLVSRPELDEERRGGAVEASLQSVEPWGRVRAEGFAAATRVEALGQPQGQGQRQGETFGRSLAGARAGLDWRRYRGKSGVALSFDAGGQFGRTDGQAWDSRWARVSAAGTVEGVSLTVAGRAGSTGGSPSRFDLFAVGGMSSAILPAALDHNRIDSPALPAASQMGDRFEGFRAELSSSGSPLLLYAERWRAWSSEKPEPIRLEGLELRLERLIPLDLPDSLSLYVGAARVRSAAPRFDSVRGYAGLIYRP